MSKINERSDKPARAGGAKSKLSPADLLSATLEKYHELGWVAFQAPKASLNDIIAQKGKKLHFVQIVTKETIDGPRHQDIAKNTFIQNAFSNSAMPIYAHVVVATKRGEPPAIRSITFENVNDSSRVIIGGKRQGTATPAEITPLLKQ
jgi:hypothetical protein